MSWDRRRKKRHFYTVQEEELIELWCKVLLGSKKESDIDGAIHAITSGGGVIVEWRDIEGRRSFLVNRDHNTIKGANDDGKQWRTLNRQLAALYKMNGISARSLKQKGE